MTFSIAVDSPKGRARRRFDFSNMDSPGTDVNADSR